MADNNKVDIAVNAHVSGADGVTQLGKKLEGTAGAATQLGQQSGAAASGLGQANTAAQGFTATSGKLRDGMESVSTQLASAKNELLALVGVGAGLQGAKDISALADSYKNLEARIRLVTGEGQAFDAAFAGVFEVARSTNSAVEETGLLFTKLAEAGKALGISQAEALKLTETINQSIQLSGASAGASSAAITQLVQALQSGVLRGDEFNSIMEQSPRLAQALAEGLSVGTGELRKMAEAGQLTSATVIKALQSQSDAVATEFGKLPATVGRAMTNLTTSFTAYVGEVDKAGGYTAKLAGVIDTLAGNLSSVATVMIHTGQVLGAMKLLSMAQDWLTASAAIKVTAGATEVATAATVQGTIAKAANTTATVANTAAQVANAAAWNGIATGLGGVGPKLEGASTAAATATTRFGAVGVALGGIVRAFAPLAALDIAFHFKEYGTAIGEWAARMAGAKDRSKELEEADKRLAQATEEGTAAIKRRAAAMQEAQDRTFGLTKEASALVVKFEELRTKGDSAADAIKAIGKDFDLSSVAGVRNAAAVLDKLVTQGKLSAAEFQEAWATALKGQDLAVFETRFKTAMLLLQDEAKKMGAALEDAIARGLSGKELKVFEDKARDALAAAGGAAQRFEQVVGAQLQEAIRRTGLDMAVISGGMGKAAQSAINDTDAIITGLDRLKAQGADTAQALTASLGKGINTADSQKAIEAVRLQVEQVRKELGAKVTDGLLDQAKQKANELKDALDKATPGINSLREAYATLGVKTKEELDRIVASHKDAWDIIKNDGTASVAVLRDAFAKYAQTAIDATGAVGSSQRAVTEATLKTEAAVKGLAITFDESGRAIVQTQAEAAAAIARTTGHVHDQRDAVDSVTSALERQNAALERAYAAKERAIALENKRLNRDAEGYSLNTKGERVQTEVQSQRSVYELAKGQGLTEAQALQIAEQFFKNGRQSGGEGANTSLGETWFTELQKAIDRLLLANAKARADAERAENAGNPQAAPGRSGSSASAAGSLNVGTPEVPGSLPLPPADKTVNVRLVLPNGTVQNVPTTESGSAALLAALHSAKLSAGV
jgi:tape measure domain-containing protein